MNSRLFLIPVFFSIAVTGCASMDETQSRSQIAADPGTQTYNINAARVYDSNPYLDHSEHKPQHYVSLSDRLLIPASAHSSQQYARPAIRNASSFTLSSTLKNNEFPVETMSYTVGEGDTVYSLARDHCTTVHVVQALNALNKDFAIRIGQNIFLPGSHC